MLPADQVDGQDQVARYLFEGVTVVSPTSGTARPDMWVGVEDGHFSAVTQRSLRGWDDAVRIDGTGLFLVPGLIDAHVHPRGRGDLDALLVHGVTTARLGRGSPTELRWKAAVASGLLRGPNLLVGSPYVWDGGPDGFGVATPDEGTVRGHVRRFRDDGYDLIKLVDLYDHALAEFLFDEAASQGIPVFGHVADDLTTPFDWEWTAGLGYRTLEHLDEVVRLVLPSPASEQALDDFVSTARRNGVAFTSILGPVRAEARVYRRVLQGEPAFGPADEARAFEVSGGNGRSQLRLRAEVLGELSVEELRAAAPDTALIARVFSRLIAAGVPILPGTEGGSRTAWAGATLHDELRLFVDWGMTPLQALRAATTEAARHVGGAGARGEIGEGFIADAILVDSDPRSDLAGLRDPVGVMVAGRWHGPKVLDEIRHLFGLGASHPGGHESGDPGDALSGVGSATHPALSPDGRRLAFMSNSEGVLAGRPIDFEIYVADADGSRARPVTENTAFDADVSWSPDGALLAFKSSAGGNDELYLGRPDGTGVRRLTDHPASDSSPHWSPDGSKIAFHSDRMGTNDLYVMNPRGDSVTVVVATDASESGPRWSPSGEQLAFVSDRAGTDDVWVVDLAEGEVRRLTTSGDSDWSPRWSPDGSEILFVSGSFADDRFDLFTIPSDGSGPPTLLLTGVDSGNATWWPSGQCITLARYVGGRSRLFVVRRDGVGGVVSLAVADESCS